MADSAAMVARKIEKQTMQLVAENTITELRRMHRDVFGIEWKGKDKAKVALKLARHVVTGNGASAPAAAAPNKKAGPTPEEEEKMARGILARVKSAWDEVEQKTEEKKTKLSECNDRINKAKESIGESLGDDTLSDTKKLGVVEGFWRTLRRTEQKKAELAKELGKAIKDATQKMKGEIDNARQLSLF
jgi:hypothetical protein